MEQKIKLFGVVGESLSHSFSPRYFNKKFISEEIKNCQYLPFEVNDASLIPALFDKHPNLIGINVTIPFKSSVIPYLQEIDTVAAQIGAVNTIVKTQNSALKGYNTDIYGFGMSIKPFFESHHERALIFGYGGAAKAIHYVLKQLGVSCVFVVRDLNKINDAPANMISYDDLGAEGIKHFKLLVNTTPVGTYPNIDDCLPIPFEGISEKHLCYDLIYNPEKTMFLKNAAARGAKTINGLNMLKLQAEKSWTIWNA